MSTNNTTNNEKILKLKGKDVLDKVKQLVKEGNVRKITIKNSKGKVLFMFPLTVGVVGILLAPLFVAIAAVTTLVSDCTITVEKTKT